MVMKLQLFSMSTQHDETKCPCLAQILVANVYLALNIDHALQVSDTMQTAERQHTNGTTRKYRHTMAYSMHDAKAHTRNRMLKHGLQALIVLPDEETKARGGHMGTYRHPSTGNRVNEEDPTFAVDLSI